MLYVALRKESVDRNQLNLQRLSISFVALRKESVDRNDNGNAVEVSDLVALRKESVDRNIDTQHLCICVIESLSARRAWIEMLKIGLMLVPSLGRSPQGERG